MKFSKMHGLGNDFLMFEDDGQSRDWSALAKQLCTRRTGVGADGLVIVMTSGKADARMRIINADGSEAEMCGNAIRCFAKYVYENGIIKKTQMQIETLAGIIKPKLTVKNEIVTSVCVDMGKPSFERASIPMNGFGSTSDVTLDVEGQQVCLSALLMGVPHAVLLTNDNLDIAAIAPAIEKHEMFPRHINVNFVRVFDTENIEVKTWERGVGFTLACGTGVCACVASLCKQGITKKKVTAHLSAGDLDIEILDDDTVLMSGPATLVYSAQTA